MSEHQMRVGTRVTYSAGANEQGGLVLMDNEDGTWNVELDDGTEVDAPADVLRTDVDQPTGDAVADAVLDGPFDADTVRLVPRARWSSPKPGPEWTRVVCFSDTHGMHEKIPESNKPAGDILLHAGDFTDTGELEQVESFGKWLAAYPVTTARLVIAGNHDTTFDETYYKDRGCSRFHVGAVRPGPYDCTLARGTLLGAGGESCIYLQDELVEVAGYTFYGSPWQPEFCDWAFNLSRGKQCAERWQQIPPAVDVLMTHGPVHGILDQTSNGLRAGCADLRAAVEERAVSVHVSGHIHEGYGVQRPKDLGSTLYVNASTCNHGYKTDNPPIVFDLPPPAELRTAASKAQETRLSAQAAAGARELRGDPDNV